MVLISFYNCRSKEAETEEPEDLVSTQNIAGNFTAHMQKKFNFPRIREKVLLCAYRYHSFFVTRMFKNV